MARGFSVVFGLGGRPRPLCICDSVVVVVAVVAVACVVMPTAKDVLSAGGC